MPLRAVLDKVAFVAFLIIIMVLCTAGVTGAMWVVDRSLSPWIDPYIVGWLIFIAGMGALFFVLWLIARATGQRL